MMLGALLIVFALLALAYAQTDTHFGFRIAGASESYVNGLYVCASDSRCSRVEPVSIGTSAPGAQLKHELSSTSVLVNGQVQKRWYISATSANGSTANVYGAIELQPLPQFKLKDWKRLGERSAFEPNMTTVPVHIPLQLVEPVSFQDTVSLRNVLEATGILVALKNDQRFDATSLRGRYVTQSLHAHHDALLSLFYGDNASLSAVSASRNLGRKETPPEGEILVQVLLCDTAAALGAVTEAGACYEAASATLSQHIERLTSVTVDGSEATRLALGRDQFSVLHCSDYSTLTSAHSHEQPAEGSPARYWHCRLRALQLRQARLLLLYSLDPLGALKVLDQVSSAGVTSAQAETWRLLAQSMLAQSAPLMAHEVSVASVGEECGAILAELARSTDYSLVHSLFAQMCARLQHSSSRSADALDQARPMVASLLSIGAVMPAAVHVRQVVREALGMPRLPLNDVNTTAQGQLRSMLTTDPALQDLLWHRCSNSSVHASTDAALVATLATSDNLRAALTLYQLLRNIQEDGVAWRIFLRDGDLMSLVLGALLQIAAPVSLNLSLFEEAPDRVASEAFCSLPPPCFVEALLVRKITIDALQDLVGACDGADSDCALSDPVSNVGARGLFLLAYQGLGLLPPPPAPSAAEMCIEVAAIQRDDASSVTCDEYMAAVVQWEAKQNLLRDSTVPSLYAQLLELTQHRLRHFTPSSRGPSHLSNHYHAQDLLMDANPASQSAIPDAAKIRVGFLSFFFRKHPVGRLLSPIIVGLDRSRFDVYIIAKSETLHSGADGGGVDAITQYLHTHVPDENWLLIDHNSVSAAERVQALELDIVVYGDVFMDSYVAHLAVRRLAPVQVAFWGHPYTTGYPSVDYFITSDLFEAPNAQTRHAHFSEQLVRFDSLSFQLFEERDTSGSSGPPTPGRRADGSSPHSTSPARRPLPPFVRRTVRSLWDDCALTAGNTTEEARSGTARAQRLRALEWITSVGYTVHDTPIVAAEVVRIVATSASLNTADNPTNTPLRTSTLCEAASTVHLYGALQSLFKLHPLFDRAIAYILTADPSALVVLSRIGKQRVWEEKFRNRLIRSVTTHWTVSCKDIASVGHCQNVDSLLKRILFVNQMKHEHYNALLCTMDVTLDTFPFGGGVTLSDALHGCQPAVPFVTQGALQSVHQIGVGIASKLRVAESNVPPRHAQQSSHGGRTPVVASGNAAGLKHLVDRYVTEAVATAAQSALLRSGGSSVGEAALSSRGRIRQALFHSTESVEEWAAFLQSAHSTLN